ncbi:DUF397 domain-containing protein [Actinomadura xylanilytica]|uniref:DUF397 domain-containing protein n=1 Tax=Actinomadura xylanilytica TaxID=887459 RepID=UPI00255A8B8F|nr:DUF397 domain-containing protein [Actinomadura xylanilytica]MDL4772599.1 DUF397 domain-containing protein [Actinomadura xylanilytica]
MTAPSRVQWRKSRRSGTGDNCVEVAQFRHSIGVRDSKAPNAGTLVFSHQAWAVFITHIKQNNEDA